MNILTFDIEDWFHILDDDATRTEAEWKRYESLLHRNLEKILGLLKKKEQMATFFCLGWVARKHPDIIEKIDSLGYEIGTHSDMHQLAYEQTRDEFTADLKASIRSIKDITGKDIKTYRAPGFSLTARNRWVFEVLLDNGIEIDCSVFPAERAHGGFKGFGPAEPAIVSSGGREIKEFPINIFRIFNKGIVFSGGGYFRVFPYWAIKRFMNRSDYVMTYFHPRDFDPDQPVLKQLSIARKFKSYYGLGYSFHKLEKLINDFEFIDLKTADLKVDWEKTKVINL